MIRTFQILAVVLLGITAYFLWQANKNGVFISIVLAACSYFVSFRFQAKARIDERNGESEQRADEE